MTTASQRRIYEARPQLVALMTALSSGDAKAAVDLIRGKTLAETGTLLIAAISGSTRHSSNSPQPRASPRTTCCRTSVSAWPRD